LLVRKFPAGLSVGRGVAKCDGILAALKVPVGCEHRAERGCLLSVISSAEIEDAFSYQVVLLRPQRAADRGES
jgi:hypothetical protein